MQLPLAGYYINLERSPDRAAFMEEQFARLGLGGMQRHDAVDGSRIPVPAGCRLLPAEYACMLSHLQVLERAGAGQCILVLEDDAELSPQLPQLLASAVQGQLLANVDIVFLECQPHMTLPHLSALWNAAAAWLVDDAAGRRVTGVELLDARSIFKWGTVAYVVTAAGREKLLSLMRGWLREGPVLPVDRCCERSLQSGELRGAITVPFLATPGLQWHGKSTIGNGWRLPDDASMVLRRLLFAGSLDGVEAMAARMQQVPADPALRMFGAVLREIADDQRQQVVEARKARR
ncbi:MAG: glycosyltransferase family 25 protein [Comamonadaceae bacterium]|nr:MAG: glycosyltransferase family 25 protein [Comamonadaceae bacterium]